MAISCASFLMQGIKSQILILKKSSKNSQLSTETVTEEIQCVALQENTVGFGKNQHRLDFLGDFNLVHNVSKENRFFVC